MLIENNAIRNFNDLSSIESIIKKCKYCHLAMVDDDKPYIVGMNFGYKNKIIYIHGAKEGRKIDVLKKNNNVSVFFTADIDFFNRHEQVACSWRMCYRSVMASGKAEFIEDYEEKLEAMKILMSTYSDKEFSFSAPSINNIAVIKIKIEEFSGRSFEY